MHYYECLTRFIAAYNSLKLYKKEQALITSYIENQHILDEELEQKYAAFTEELQEYSDNFRNLIDNAFAPDFRDAFLKSIAFAKAAGVNGDDILSSVEDIDDFFMD